MTKKHFIALAYLIKTQNQLAQDADIHKPFLQRSISLLADFCEEQNPRFNRARWLYYIAGECGPNGGAAKGRAA